MLNTSYIKNKGASQTIVRKNNRHYISQTNWDADYDGDVANISLDQNENGVHRHYQISLDNDDLANMLNIESVNIPIHKRLEMDFNDNFQPRYNIEVIPESMPESMPVNNIASPAPGEQFIVSVPSQPEMANYYTLTPRRKHRRHKSHVSHKVHRVSKSKSRNKTRSSRKSSSRR